MKALAPLLVICAPRQGDKRETMGRQIGPGCRVSPMPGLVSTALVRSHTGDGVGSGLKGSWVHKFGIKVPIRLLGQGLQATWASTSSSTPESLGGSCRAED